MATKRFRGKTCAYCAVEGIAEAGEHVLARAFVPKGPHRANLPKVPACRECNSAKEAIEDYVQVVAVLAGRHRDDPVSVRESIDRKFLRRPNIMRELMATVQPALEKTSSGVLLRTGQMTIDVAKIKAYFEYLVRGLYFHHTATHLAANAQFYQMMPGLDDEIKLIDMTQCAFGPDIIKATGTYGAGILDYDALISRTAPNVSAWQIEFGKMRWAGAVQSPRLLLSRRYITTLPPNSDSAA